MAETSSSEEETPPGSGAGPSAEATDEEAEGKTELERRTKAVEEALGPLIQQVSPQQRLSAEKMPFACSKHDSAPPPFSCADILPLPQITELGGGQEPDPGKPLPPSVERLAQVAQRATETLVSLGEQIASENRSFQVRGPFPRGSLVVACDVRTRPTAFSRRSCCWRATR